MEEILKYKVTISSKYMQWGSGKIHPPLSIDRNIGKLPNAQ